MSIIFILIPISIVIATGFLLAFVWAVKSGQYEDTCTPSMRLLTDDANGKLRRADSPPDKPERGCVVLDQPRRRGHSWVLRLVCGAGALFSCRRSPVQGFSARRFVSGKSLPDPPARREGRDEAEQNHGRPEDLGSRDGVSAHSLSIPATPKLSNQNPPQRS